MMSEKSIEEHIKEALVGDAHENALDFIAFLRANEMQFARGKGYWEDKLYWMVNYNCEYACFVLINGSGNTDKLTLPISIEKVGCQFNESATMITKRKPEAWIFSPN